VAAAFLVFLVYFTNGSPGLERSASLIPERKMNTVILLRKGDEMENPASGASSDRALTPKARGTRERILRAALALFFAKKGYEATTMRAVACAVAREAGTGLGPAYHCYASKKEFALAPYLRLAEDFEEWARETVKGRG
jgi:tetracycline repressor-like protein